MKILMFAVLATLISTQAFAKITLYSNKDAVLLVLNDESTMAKVVGKASASELRSVSVSSSGKVFNQNFTVRLQYAVTNSRGNVRACYSDVNVSTIMKQVGLPGGGPGISTNKLVIKSVAKAVCSI